MTKNKKKLRRAERRYSVTRTAQTLVLTGMLLAGGVTGAMAAATEINGAATWDASAASGAIEYNGTTGNNAAVATSAANTTGGLTTLTITGDDTAAALTADNDLTFTGAVSISGASGNLGSLIISAGKTVTTGGTTVGDYGTLDISGTHVGTLTATGANSSAIDLTGTQKGNVTLNGAGATLTAKNDDAAVWGNVTVTNGTLSTASNSMTVNDAAGTGLGNVTLGANSTLTLSTSKALTVGSLVVNKDTAVAGLLHLNDVAGTHKLTLNDDGFISFEDVNGISTNATLSKAGATGVVLGTGGNLTAADLILTGFDTTNNALTATNAVELKANRLIMDNSTLFGSTTATAGTTVTIRSAANGTTGSDFINQDIGIAGKAGAVGILNLGTSDATGTATTGKDIMLTGAANSDEALLNVQYGTFAMRKLHVGAANDDAASTKTGTITVSNGGTLTAQEIGLHGLSSAQAAKLVVSDNSNVNVGTLAVGGSNSFGDVSLTGTAADKTAMLSVTDLQLGDAANAKVTVGSHGILDIKGNFAIAQGNLGDTGKSLNVGSLGFLQVRDTLNITNNGTDVTAAVDAGGTVRANVLKADDGTKKLTWNGGQLNLLGDSSGKLLLADGGLEITSGLVTLGSTVTGMPANNGSYTKELTINGGTLTVLSNEYTLTNAGKDLTLANTGGTFLKVEGGTLNLALGAGKNLTVNTSNGLDLSGGVMNLTGNLVTANNGSLLMSGESKLDVSGNVTTGGAGDDITVGGTAQLTVAGNATITKGGTNGGLFVNGGSVAVAGLTDIGANGVVNVASGSLTTGSIQTITGSGVSLVGDGNSTATLTVKGNTAGTSVKTVDNKLKLNTLGTVVMDYAAVVDNTGKAAVAGVGKVDANNTTGVLKLVNGAQSIALTDYNTLKGNLLANGGTLRLDGTTVTGVDENTNVSAVDGVAVPDQTVTFTSGSSLTASGTEIKSLIINNAGATGLTVSGAGASLALAGTNDKDFQLVKNTNAGAGTTTLTATNGATLSFGLTGGDTLTAGTLTGNVALDKGTLQAVNGEFVITGTVTDANNASHIKVANSKLTTGAITLNQSNSAVEVGNRGSLIATATSSVKDVTLDGGGFAVTGNNDLTVGEDLTISNGGVLSAGKDLILSGATIGTLDGASIVAGNNINATGKDLAAGAKGLGIQAKTATVDDLIGTAGKLTVIVSDKLTANTITANSDTASYIQVGELAVTSNVGLANNAALVITDATKDSTIGGTLTLGTAGTDNSAASMTVAGKVTVTGNTDLNNGSSLNVNEFVATNNTTISVGNTADTKGSSLAINKMTLAGATVFLDPSWVAGTEYQDAGTASRAAIKEFAAGIDGELIAGQNSQLALGTANVEQLTSAIRQMGNVWGASGITAALGIYAPQELKTGGAITVNGASTTNNTSFTANTAAFGENSLLVVDSKAGLGADGALKGQSGTSVLSVDAKAKLHIIGGKANQTINIVSGFDDNSTGSIAAGGWDGTNLTSDTALLSPTRVAAFDKATGKGTYSVNLGQNAATSVFPMLSSSMGGLVDTMVRDTGVDPMSSNTGIRFISRAASDSYIGRNNTTEAAATIEGAAQLAAVGAVPGMTLGAMQAATNAVTTRTSFASPLLDTSKAVALHKDVVDGTVSLDSGLSAGDSMKNGIGLWIMPLYQSNSVWGMEAENFDTGYKSDLGGVALGVDYTINDAFRFGVGLNLGGGYAQSTGDFNKTDNSFNFWGVNLYGGWAQNNFGLTGDVGYTSSYNKLKQELPSSMQMDDIKSDVTSSAWTAGLRGEYKFATEALDIIPHVGVRYTGLTTDDYKAKSGGGTVFKVDQDFQSIWTFPVGVTFAKEITTDSGWTFRPQVDLGITPATGDVKAKSKVRVPGIDAAAEMKMQVVDYMSYDGGIGLEMKKDNVSFGINYNIQASEHRTGHGVFGTLRYEF